MSSVCVAANAQGRRRLPEKDKAAELESVLSQVELHIEEYRRSVPNLFCTERAIATRTEGGSGGDDGMAVPGGSVSVAVAPAAEDEVSTVATVRLRRVEQTGSFEETRAVLRSERSRGSGDPLAGAPPMVLQGVFSNGLNLFSQEARGCFRYDLRDKLSRPTIRVGFAELPRNERASYCPEFQDTSGTVEIETATMHVIALEKRVPHQRLTATDAGAWEWQERYRPVDLAGKTFWMPSSIRSEATSDGRGPRWKFSATYDEYHLFHSESRILK